MHTYNTYEKAPRRRQRPSYKGLIAIICLFASIFVAWAVVRTSVVKTSLEMMSSPTGMTSDASDKTVGKP